MSITKPHSPRSGSKAKPRSGRPSQEAAAALPLHILSSARTIFLEQGYAATSLQQIATHAGATKRTLYVKFGDKEALFSAVVVDVLRDWRLSTAEQSCETDDPLRQRLERIGRRLLTNILAQDMVKLQRIMAAETYRFPWLADLLIQQTEEGPIPQIGRLLMEARGSAQLSAHDRVSARLLNDMITGPPLRLALWGIPSPVTISDSNWVSWVVGLFLNGWTSASGLELDQ